MLHIWRAQKDYRRCRYDDIQLTQLNHGEGSIITQLRMSSSSSSSAADPLCTVGRVCDAFEAMATIANETLLATTSIKIVKLSKWVEPLFNELASVKVREATRLGTAITDGKYAIPAEKVDEFNAIIAPIADRIVVVPPQFKLTSTELEGAKASPTTINRMKWFLTDFN